MIQSLQSADAGIAESEAHGLLKFDVLAVLIPYADEVRVRGGVTVADRAPLCA